MPERNWGDFSLAPLFIKRLFGWTGKPGEKTGEEKDGGAWKEKTGWIV